MSNAKTALTWRQQACPAANKAWVSRVLQEVAPLLCADEALCKTPTLKWFFRGQYRGLIDSLHPFIIVLEQEQGATLAVKVQTETARHLNVSDVIWEATEYMNI